MDRETKICADEWTDREDKDIFYTERMDRRDIDRENQTNVKTDGQIERENSKMYIQMESENQTKVQTDRQKEFDMGTDRKNWTNVKTYGQTERIRQVY